MCVCVYVTLYVQVRAPLRIDFCSSPICSLAHYLCYTFLASRRDKCCMSRSWSCRLSHEYLQVRFVVRRITRGTRAFVHQWSHATLPLLRCTSVNTKNEPGEVGRQAGRWRKKGAGGSFRAGRRGAHRATVYSSAFEKITILFFAHRPGRPARLVALERSNHAGGFSHALMRNYRCSRLPGRTRARLLFCGRPR